MQSLKTVGIIAEYNPFHNGHKYQIEEIRRRTGAENIIAVMGGNFLQRGVPAFADKYLRTQAALACGVDLVIELPTIYSTASAETFAYGGVSLLHQLECVDGICFGSECGDLAPLSAIADFLSEEPKEFSEQLRSLVSAGSSYPAARNQVLKEYFPDIFTAYPDLLTSPNNILGIEYLKALRRLESTMVPITIPRSDEGYHADTAKEQYLSASAIRSRMQEYFANCPSDNEQIIENADFSDFLPEEVNKLLVENPSRFPVTLDDFSEYLFYALNTLKKTEVLELSDMSEDLWNRITKEFVTYSSFSSFAEQLKSKQYTHSRITRVLCHILLQIKKDPLNTPALYGRILGLRMEKSGILREIKHFPMINKLADAEKVLKKFAADFFPTQELQNTYVARTKSLLQIDIDASNLYRRALLHKTGTSLPEEHLAGVIRYDNGRFL